MNKTVLILVGLPGAGKTTASQFFISRNIPVLRMGKLTDHFLKKEKLPITEANERSIRGKLRHDFGENYYAKSMLPQVKRKLVHTSLVIVEGVRSEAEMNYFKKNLTKIELIYLSTKKKFRIARLLKRQKRPMTYPEIIDRDRYEINTLKINKLKKYSDIIITNNLTVDNFNQKLKSLINSYGQTKNSFRN